MKLFQGAFILAFAVSAWGQGDRPVVTVAYTSRAPVLDGQIDPQEWRDAATISGFVQAGGAALAEPNARAYLLFDDRALYVAVQCIEPDPSGPRGFPRAHDDRVFEDDSVQVFLAPEDLRQAKPAPVAFREYAGAYNNWFAGLPAYVEFTVNCRGSRTEARNDVRDWDAPWRARVGRNREGWEAEWEIPFPSLGVEQAPENALWGFNLFRNRQSALSGWVCPGFGGYTPTPLGAMRLIRDHPVAQQFSVPRPRRGRNALRLGVRNPTAKAVEVEVGITLPQGETIAQPAALPPGGFQTIRVPYRLAGEGDLSVRYRVQVRGEEVPLLSGIVPLNVPPRLTLGLRYYALPGRVEGNVHLEPEARAARAILTVQPAEGPASIQRMDLRGRSGAILRLPAPTQVGRRFHARLEVWAADGQCLARKSGDFTVPPKPPWIGTKAGLPLGVLPPWTPMKVRGKTVEMLGKRVTFRDLALPATLFSAGAEMLAAPIRVGVAVPGRRITWRSKQCRITEKAADQVRLESLWHSSPLDLRVTSTVEYDGFCWHEMTLIPHGPVRVSRLALEVPFRPEVCRYAYEGHAQAAHALSPWGLRRPLGSNLWFGDESRGLAWLAESLEWVQAKDRGRQVEIIPGARATLWRSTFIDTPTELKAPYTARFALHLTPAKPVSLPKSRIFHGAYYGLAQDWAAGQLRIPAKGHLNLAQGTLECWVQPTFDTQETYDPQLDRSAYNRMFFTLGSDAGEFLILYYNADDRSLRVVTTKPGGGYSVVLGGPAPLPPGEWSYVKLSWGDQMRLNINGRVAEFDVQGSLGGSIEGATLDFTLAHFNLDELRLSKSQRLGEGCPQAPLPADAETLFLDHFEDLPRGAATEDLLLLRPGKFGRGLGCRLETRLDQLAREGKRIVIFHENWSRYQGYPDLEQVPKLKELAQACHARGMLFLVYFCQMMSDAAPEWQGLENDFMALPERRWYHRDDVPQDCYVSCVNGPYGDLLLEGIARLAEEAGIDGVYMDGTTVPWDCANPTHPGCGEARADGTYLPHEPIRAARQFMKRLRNIFAQRRRKFFLDAHTGGCIHIATQSFCDGYYDGEHLARYKPGFRLAPDAYLTGYLGKQFGFRGEFLPNRHTMDQALAIALVHDTAVRGQPPAVDRAWGDYEDALTRSLPYWRKSRLYTVRPATVLGSVYLKPDRALVVLGNQAEKTVECRIELAGLLRKLPAGVQARDALTQETLAAADGKLQFPMPGRSWRMIELKRP